MVLNDKPTGKYHRTLQFSFLLFACCAGIRVASLLKFSVGALIDLALARGTVKAHYLSSSKQQAHSLQMYYKDFFSREMMGTKTELKGSKGWT